MKIIITLGDFDDKLGYGTIIQIDLDNEKIKKLVKYIPPKTLRVPSKGFIGACWSEKYKKTLFVCSFSALYEFNTND